MLSSAGVILTILPRGHQSHPTIHILRKPGTHPQITIVQTLVTCQSFHLVPCWFDIRLPLQYWCFPNCHSHRGEQSRQAAEREQPEFVLTAKSWLPAWFRFDLSLLGGRCNLVCLLLNLLRLSVVTMIWLSVYIHQCDEMTLPHKLYFLRRGIPPLPGVAYAAVEHPSLIIPCLFIWLT